VTDSAPARPVTAVIVTYQSARTIARTLAAARRCHDERLLDTIVVDNDSTDGTRGVIAREADWARVILSDKNNGFGRGCNIGFAHVTSPYTILINPDAVVESEAIRTMLRFMEQEPTAGIVAPATLCGEDGGETVLQHMASCPTPWTIVRSAIPILRRRSTFAPIVPGAAPVRTGWVAGAVLMIRTDLVRRLEGFDPRFFLYWEETDLCKRVQDAGFGVWALGTALARHVVGASSRPEKRFLPIAKHYFQSRYYYMAKHYGWLAATAAEVSEFALEAVQSVVDGVRGRGLHRLRRRLQAPLLSMPQADPG
jgi:N-acetylglucosaminyl-diphospho-decaprenol L-rhamnosyltransferase